MIQGGVSAHYSAAVRPPRIPMPSFPKVGHRLSRVALAGLIVTTAKFSGVGHRSRFAPLKLASGASTARRTELSFAAAVEVTDGSSGQQKV
jgi:hypothetical protein